MASAAVVVLLAGMQTVSASPAAALPDLDIADGDSGVDSVSPKTAIATCPAGLKVVGGGGEAATTLVADDGRVTLTRLEPVHSGNVDSYVVTGMEVAPGYGGNWGVRAWALCGTAPAGYEVVSGSTPSSSSFVQQAAAVCPGNKQVIGTGAQINNPGGEVTLQLARSSGSRDIARVTAKEDANGYARNWNVTAYAICTNPLPGFSLLYRGPTLTGSENKKIETLECPPGTQVHNVAAATSGQPPGLDTAPPGVAIMAVIPQGGRFAGAVAVETTPTNASWDFVIQAICGP
jgi:hypothetical protein